MGKTIRVGVVGTGMGRHHMEGFAKQDGVELAAICDLNKPEAAFFADQYGVDKAKVFTDCRKMFSLPELHSATSTPNG
ncbi:MAG: Gfo/Idh/MocA family oxidoreductase [Nitrospiraceae bacterium]|nr:Gfo/Idh/MocA family oxidoreductase [Nitrospiraceae bacterium]